MKWLSGEKGREGEERKEDREVVVVVAGLLRESLGRQTREEGGRCILSCRFKELLITTYRDSHHGRAG